MQGSAFPLLVMQVKNKSMHINTGTGTALIVNPFYVTRQFALLTCRHLLDLKFWRGGLSCSDILLRVILQHSLLTPEKTKKGNLALEWAQPSLFIRKKACMRLALERTIMKTSWFVCEITRSLMLRFTVCVHQQLCQSALDEHFL